MRVGGWERHRMIDHEALVRSLSGTIVRRSLMVALIIGSVLTAINQGDVILSGQQPVWWKVVLTYCVPFCVATYGAYSALAAPTD